MLTADLHRLGLKAGVDVLVHSSLSRLGCVVGGAAAVIDALVDVVAPGGTVLFPALTGTDRDGPASPPTLYVRDTPCRAGRIPETARHYPGAVRSLHPTHSVVALGAAAARYAAGHEHGATPCDEHSPYFRLIADGGFILLLGVTQASNTTVHCLEELAAVPYHLQPTPTNGVVIDVLGRRHIVRNRLHLWGWQRDFPTIDAPLLSLGAERIGRVGRAGARLVHAGKMASVLLPFLRDDPFYLLTAEARRSWAAARPSISRRPHR